MDPQASPPAAPRRLLLVLIALGLLGLLVFTFVRMLQHAGSG